MNNKLLEKAKMIIASLSAEELESKLTAYGIEFTRQFVMFEDIAEELSLSAENTVLSKNADMASDFSDFHPFKNLVLDCAVNDNSYALAA